MNTTIKHGSLTVLLIGLLMTGCESRGLSGDSASATATTAQGASAGFMPAPFEAFTVTNIGRPMGARIDQSSDMTLIGWAADGLPVYTRYGYSDPIDATTFLSVLQVGLPPKTARDASRPDTELYAMGTISADYE